MDSNLEPLLLHTAGVLAVAVAATISITIITLFSVFASITIYQFLRQTSLERLNNETRGSRFLCSTGGFLLLNMLTGDLLQAIGFSFNYSWFHQGGIPIVPTPLCTAQGVLIEVGDLASTFGSLILAIHLFLILVFSYKPAFRWILSMVLFSWSVIIVLATIGPRHLEVDGIPFYGMAGGWCWISSTYQDDRLYLLYLFVFLVSGINICLYTIIYATIYRRRLKHVTTSGPDSSAVARILLIYPLIYVVTMTPLAITRVSAIAGLHWPVRVQLAAGVIFTLSGTANVVVYSSTRRIVSKESVVSVIKTIARAGQGSFSRRSSDGSGGNIRGSANRRRSDESEAQMAGVASASAVTFDVSLPRRGSDSTSNISEKALITKGESEKEEV